ncbi:minor coat protein [Maribacter phage Panino]
MIIIEDDYLLDEDFKRLQEYCRQDFYVKRAGTEDEWKEFLVLDTPKWLRSELEMDGYEIILSFIRKAHSEFDTEPRIHSDGIIMDRHVDMASVLYINDSEGVTPNGTSFYDHAFFGGHLPKNVSGEVYNDVLRDSNVIEFWEQKDKIYAEPNRLLTYPAQKFHAKFPSKIEKGERIVCVTFYAEKNEE